MLPLDDLEKELGKQGPLHEGTETQGWYAYGKYRTPIKLAVNLQGGQVVAVEQAASPGRFELTIAGGSLVGTWTDLGRHKELPVVVQ